MSKVLIIGAGGVGGVVAHKCAQVPETFSEILLASRTKSKCDAIAAQVKEMQGRDIQTAQLDADDPKNTVALIREFKPELVINVALPYQDLAIMDACLETGVHYLDTANYEPPDVAKFEYHWQWAYRERFEKAGLTALLGCGFDPGQTNIYCAWAQKHHFDEIHTIDIMDCNAGDHGKAFATNFNPEINIREITQNGRYWENGEWKETKPLEIHTPFDFAEAGRKEMYLLYHEEMESLVENIPGLKRIRFWMTFGQPYITHLEVLQNVGMTSIEPIDYEGHQIVPLQFLKAVLPKPESLGENYTGKTNIGCWIEGLKDGQFKRYYIYNVCDHAECYREVRSQAISYTTGVPAMLGAKLLLEGVWKKPGVWNMEQLDPDPFMHQVGQYGLPWVETTPDGPLPL
ncbi:MAG: saccharopine dehydrogenase family protein [Deltaproteobacteria bacterium]|nr:MAG: saccharopine dehydrogenase family protein [Deltaproteobacteria bacterium]